MSKGIWILVFIVALFCLIGIPEQATATTTGKIAGRVTDNTGESLPGANVVIVGTSRGATTDTEGFYMILLADPGIWQVEASLIGYQKVRQENVKVVVGYTTTVDFTSRETTLEGEEIVVTAARPAVEPDKTSSKHYVTAQDIAMTPVIKDVASWAGLQPGVQHDGRSVRSGNFATYTNHGTVETNREDGWYTTTPKPIGMTYTVDGVRMVNNDRRSANMFVGVNRSSIQEIAVVTGVPEAEYGNMDAGMINIVTKEGGRDYHGFSEYRYTLPGQKHFGFDAYDPQTPAHVNLGTGKSRLRDKDANWLKEGENIGADGLPGTGDDTGRLVHIQPVNYTDIRGHRVEGSLSGPLGNKASLHLSALTDMQPYQRPRADLRSLPNIQLTGKVAFHVSSKINLKVGGVYGKNSIFRVLSGSAMDGSPSGEGGISRGMRDIFQPASMSSGGKEINTDGMVYAVLTHALSPRTLYELRISRSDSKVDTSGVPDDSFNYVRDADNWYTIHRFVRDFRYNEQTRYNVKLDFSSQLTKGNFFKAGVDATWYSSYHWWANFRNTSGVYRIRTIYDYYESAINRWGKDGQMDSVPIRTGAAATFDGQTADWLPDFGAGGSLDDPAWTGYKDYPRKAMGASFYLQDKMEFEGMVVNLGLRLDTYRHDGQFRPMSMWSAIPHFRFLSDSEAGIARQAQNPYPGDITAFPTWEGRDMLKFSPRFGISHPITDRSAIHFSYGRFFVLPIFYAMYGQTWINAPGMKTAVDLNKDGRLSSYEYLGGYEMGTTKRGTTSSKPGRATNYELGIDWNFVTDYKATITMYFRRTEDYLQQNNPFWWDPVGKARVRAHWYANTYSGETRGLELAFSKRFSNHFSFRATWSFYWEQNNFYGGPTLSRFWPDSNFIAKGAYRYRFEIDPATGTRIWQPLTSQEIDALGKYADKQLQAQITRGTNLWLTTKFASQVPTAFVGTNDGSYGGGMYQESDVATTVGIAGGVRGPANKRDTIGDGSITFLMATPTGFGPSIGENFRLLGDLNINLVLRIQPGTVFFYNPSFPTPSRPVVTSTRLLYSSATAFNTDLGIEKGFRMGKFRPVVFMEATNLFNGRKPKPIRRWNFFHYIPKYGLAENEPDPLVTRQGNVQWDPWDSFRNRTREVYFGVRLSM